MERAAHLAAWCILGYKIVGDKYRIRGSRRFKNIIISEGFCSDSQTDPADGSWFLTSSVRFVFPWLSLPIPQVLRLPKPFVC